MKAKSSFIFLFLLMASLPLISYGQASGGAIKRPVKKPAQTTTAPAKPIKQSKPTTASTSVSSQTITVGGVSFKMIRVEGLGNPFYIGETEVTQALWEAVMGSNPSNFKGANRPVENVSWNDCKEFISRLNSTTGKTFRLPKGNEWEYAAKGGNKSHGYKYSGSNTMDEVGWYNENSGNETHDVKTKSPNELGLYDMSGNVLEWCEDLYDSSSSRRMYRGGSLYAYARYCRVSIRNFDTPDNESDCLGLRLAL